MISEDLKDIYSVSSLTKELKAIVETRYRFIKVQGEISNLKQPFSGHSYFTLKDANAQIRTVLFKGQARYLPKPIENGQQVICHGRLSIYEPRGDYQLIVDSVESRGSGLLQLKFEKLKKMLHDQGLFDSSLKQSLPLFPKKIILVTSPSGAAVHDFLKIWRKRNFPVDIDIFPVRVQGMEAAREISDALTFLNRTVPETDAVVLCRGGGSLEDLWPFNEEILARAIHHSIIPVVSAIGHEIDFSISDFCADLRAPTPTAAAEMLIPDGLELQSHISRIHTTIGRIMVSKIEDHQYQIEQNRRLLGDMDSIFTHSSLRLDHAGQKLVALMKNKLRKFEDLCATLSLRLKKSSPEEKMQSQTQRLHFAMEKLYYLINRNLGEKEASLLQQATLLDAVSPLATMARGYSISSKIDVNSGLKTLLRDIAQLNIDDRIEVRLHRGKVECGVIRLLDS